MKFTPTITPKQSRDEERRWPVYMLRGRVRTSTVALIVAFLAVWWVYTTYRTDINPSVKTQTTKTQVVPVPPGFKPDPDYTWVPRSEVQEPPTSVTPTTTTPPTTTSPSPTITTTTPPPPFQLPCIQPFCTPTPTTPTPQQPLPGPGPSPTSAPPAR